MTSSRVRAAAALGLLAAAGCAPSVPSPEPTNPIRFLSINDVYVADTARDGSGGLARVATMRARIAAEGPTLFVLAGDVLSPSVLSKYYHGLQMVEALNAARLDYATFGNHEFDLPRDTLVARIAASRFKWLSANCGDSTGAPFPGVPAWDTVRITGRKVGLFGLTLQGDYPGYVRCTDPDSAARRMLDTLSAQKADLIVAITHQTAEADRALLNREFRLDLILGGHEHEAQTIAVSGRHALKADANARTAQFATLWGEKGHWRQAVALLPVHGGIAPDSATARVVAAWADSLRRRLGPERRVAVLDAELDARAASQRRGETVLGDLATDAMRAGTGADLALLNAGAMRLDDVLPAGPLTSYQVEALFPYADETRTVTVALAGGRVRELLERSVSDSVLGRGGFLQVSGLSFTYDPVRPSGRRVLAIRTARGTELGATDTVSVTLPRYVACRGGDGYRVPEAAEPCRAEAPGPRVADLLQAYLRDSLRGRVAPPPGDRIVRR